MPSYSHSANGMNFDFKFSVAVGLAGSRFVPMKETKQLSAVELKALLKLAAIEFGRRGGKQTSEAKRTANRANAIKRWAKVKAAKGNDAN